MILDYKGSLRKKLIVRFCVFAGLAGLVFLMSRSDDFEPMEDMLWFILFIYAACMNTIAMILECRIHKGEKSLRNAGFDANDDSATSNNGGKFRPTVADSFYHNTEIRTKIKRLDIMIGIPVMSGLVAILIIFLIYYISSTEQRPMGLIFAIIYFTWHVIKLCREYVASKK